MPSTTACAAHSSRSTTNARRPARPFGVDAGHARRAARRGPAGARESGARRVRRGAHRDRGRCSESAAMQLLARGLRSRHVGATKMNRESSRSHAVFSLYVQSSSEASTSAAAVPSPRRVIARSSRLALVDLAGSGAAASHAHARCRERARPEGVGQHQPLALSSRGRDRRARRARRGPAAPRALP